MSQNRSSSSPRDGEVPHQPSGLVEHRGESDRADLREAARQHVIEPRLGLGPVHLVAGVLRDLVGARRRAHRFDLLTHDRLGVGAPQRVEFLEVRDGAK